MLKAFDAACFGYVSFDTRYLVDKYPSENLWTEIRTQQTDLGGDAAIIASNLASLGFRVGLVGTGIGSDEMGKKIRIWLAEKGIVTSIDNLYEINTYNLVFLSVSGG